MWLLCFLCSCSLSVICNTLSSDEYAGPASPAPLRDLSITFPCDYPEHGDPAPWVCPGDQIRSPARAQDLILRHRVKGYRSGDLERATLLSISKRMFCMHTVFFLEPSGNCCIRGTCVACRNSRRRFWKRSPYSALCTRPNCRTLERLESSMHGAATRKQPPRRWSTCTTAVFFALRGAKTEFAFTNACSTLVKRQRSMNGCPDRIMLIANILAPLSESSLLTNTRRFSYLGNPRPVLCELLNTGALQAGVVDGVRYVWPYSIRLSPVPRRVRFLAPFDPLVWDRRRFEHFWGWAYRFEAYTPAAKRVRGYYAMPLLCVMRLSAGQTLASTPGN